MLRVHEAQKNIKNTNKPKRSSKTTLNSIAGVVARSCHLRCAVGLSASCFGCGYVNCVHVSVCTQMHMVVCVHTYTYVVERVINYLDVSYSSEVTVIP